MQNVWRNRAFHIGGLLIWMSSAYLISDLRVALLAGVSMAIGFLYGRRYLDDSH